MWGNCAWCLGMFACSACGDCIKASFKQQVRLAYLVFDLVWVAAALLVMYGFSHLLTDWPLVMKFLVKFVHCPQEQGFSCLGISLVYRISLALAVMHFLVLIMCLMRNGCSRVFNEEVWPFKILFVGATTAGLMFIPNETFKYYSNFAMVISFIFLLFQIVMIIDLFYLWGVNWVKKYDEGANIWMYVLIAFTAILYGGAIYFVVMGFIQFTGCGVGTWVSIINVVCMVIGIVLILLHVNPDGSLLTSGAVGFFTSYLNWSGLSGMEDTCNYVANKESTTIINLCFGLAIIITSMVYVSIGSKAKNSGNVAPAGVNIPAAVLAEGKEEEGTEKMLDEEAGGRRKSTKTKVAPADEEKKKKKKKSDEDESDDEEEEERKNRKYKKNGFIYYHIIMIFASCYISMLLSNWGSPIIQGQKYQVFRQGDLSMWVKLGTAWATSLIYIWTLLAPKIFPDRDFS